MVNAWSLAASILNGTFDKDYPMKKDKDEELKELDDSGITIQGGFDGVETNFIGSGNTASLYDGLDYEDMYSIGMETAGCIELDDVDDRAPQNLNPATAN